MPTLTRDQLLNVVDNVVGGVKQRLGNGCERWGDAQAYVKRHEMGALMTSAAYAAVVVNEHAKDATLDGLCMRVERLEDIVWAAVMARARMVVEEDESCDE